MENKKQFSNNLNWIVVFLWGWYLLSSWTRIPVPSFIVPNSALAAFFIFGLQILIVFDWKKAVFLKDKDINWLILIGSVTVVCLLLAKSNFGAFFTVFNFCMLLYLSDKIRWKKDQLLVLGLVYLIIFINWVVAPIVADRNANSNMAGTIMAFSMFGMVVLIESIITRTLWKRLLEALLIVFCFRQIAIFHGRGTFLALIAYCILWLFIPKHFWNKRKLYLSVVCALTVGSALFAIIYTYIWRYLRGSELENVRILGKSVFSGREVIWNEIWDLFLKSPLWGTGTNFELKNYFEFNLHNAMFDILTVHGIFVFILVVIYIFNRLKNLHIRMQYKPIFIPAMAGCFSVMVESFTDMDLLWAPQLMVWSFILVVLSSCENAEE